MAHSMVGILVKRVGDLGILFTRFRLILGGFECGLRFPTNLSAG
jgi:hypothetical protein